MHSSDFLSHLTHDRQQDRLAAAAVHRLVPSSPVRTRLARSLRRTADRLDAATTISQGAPRAREIGI